MIASDNREILVSPGMSFTKERSTFTLSIGKRFRYASDE